MVERRLVPRACQRCKNAAADRPADDNIPLSFQEAFTDDLGATRCARRRADRICVRARARNATPQGARKTVTDDSFQMEGSCYKNGT
jgi:hypothetical protein